MRNITIIDLYKDNFRDNTNLIKLLADNSLDVKLFSFLSTPRKKFKNKIEVLFQEIFYSIKILSIIHTFRHRDVLCFVGHYSILLFNSILGSFLFPGFHLYIYNFYIHALGEKRIIRTLLRFLLGKRNITLIIQSPFEYEYYSSMTKGKIIFIPCCEDTCISVAEFISPHSDYIFTGGYTNRDYQTMLEVAKRMPSYNFIFAVSSLNLKSFPSKVPDNVIIYNDIDPKSFWGIAQKSKCIIVPLKKRNGCIWTNALFGSNKAKETRYIL